jgi:hypothetical protein
MRKMLSSSRPLPATVRPSGMPCVPVCLTFIPGMFFHCPTFSIHVFCAPDILLGMPDMLPEVRLCKYFPGILYLGHALCYSFPDILAGMLCFTAFLTYLRACFVLQLSWHTCGHALFYSFPGILADMLCFTTFLTFLL